MTPLAPETVGTLLSPGRDSAALALPDQGSELGYGQLAEATEDLGGILRSAGVGRGDVVAIVVPDGPVFLRALLAVTAIGAAAAPLNPAYTEDEYRFYFADLQPRLLLLPAGELPAARAAAGSSVQLAELVEEGGRLALRRDGTDFSRRQRFEPAEPDDVALLLHTSGTTSRPKQVPLRHRNLVASARTIASHYRLGADDVSYSAMPLFHVHGLVASVFAAFAGGGACVVPRRFSPRRLLQQLEPHGVTWFSASPTTHQIVLERVELSRGAVAAPSLRFLRSCSSAMPPALMERIEARFAVPLLEAYGMTEASHQISSNPLPPGRRMPGSVGLPTGTEVAIVDREGTLIPAGATGEVVIRGPGVTPGYLNNPDANAEAFFDGWFRTGDLGSFDVESYLRLEGRLKEMINRGGENISPYEVEDTLGAHPAVADVACFGVADEKYGEEVVAAVSLAGEATTGELLDHCRARLAAYKVPKAIHIVDSIPRTPTGKLQRQRVAALLGLSKR